MALYLVDLGQDMSIELFLSESVERALALQWERIKDRTAREAFCRRMASHLESVIPDSIDWDIKEPTSAQVSFAMALSKELDVPVPPEALRFRGSMHEFLEQARADGENQTRVEKAIVMAACERGPLEGPHPGVADFPTQHRLVETLCVLAGRRVREAHMRCPPTQIHWLEASPASGFE